MKQKLLKVLNIVLMLLFLAQLVTVMLYDWIPSKLNGNESVIETHEIIGTLLFVMIALHLILNWSWVRRTYGPKPAPVSPKITKKPGGKR